MIALTAFLDTSDEWIRTRTGILERRVLSDEKLEDLAIEAAEGALANAILQASELDFILASNVIGLLLSRPD
jgi:3-oxoacyl-[acyl-carrier-protein] synthase-3